MTQTPSHRCSIVPPHMLERLAASAEPQVALAAQQALIDVDRGLRPSPGVTATPGARQSDLTHSTLEAGPVRLISDARNGTELPGDQVRGEGDPDTGDVAVTEAYDGLGHTWQLFAEAFQRNSLDNQGLPLRATVHYGRDYDNAFWDGTQMVFGDGDGTLFTRFTASLDVIGHELSHGVVEYTAGLIYQGQPGALNESVSDVFGSLVRQRATGQDAASADWLIGADLLIGEAEGMALRSMKEPGTAYDTPILGKDPQPGHMDDYVDTDADHGGVHINSGIPNKAFYLLATGLGGNAWEAPGAIWYATITGPGIAADCDFVTFAGLTQRAATDLYGADSAEAAAVTQAWQQVGVLAPEPAEPEDPTGQDPDEIVAAGPVGDLAAASAVGTERIEVTRSGGFAGRTVSTVVALDELPDPIADAWRALLYGGTLQALDDGAPAVPDSFCYGVACEVPRVRVTIPEQQLPSEMKNLFDTTLRSG